MASIRILHASDLHISVHKQLRSPIDKLRDLDDPSDELARRVAAALRSSPKIFFTAWWKRMYVSSCDAQILEDLAEFIYENARIKLDGGIEITEDGEEKLDAVVLTGDLATTGSTDDIEQTRKFLRARFNPERPHKSNEDDYSGATLSAVKVPVLYLPGNHDRYVFTRDWYGFSPKFFTPGGTEFDRLLSDYRQHPIQSIELTAEVSKDKKLKTVILAADLALEQFDDHEGFLGWLAQGKAYSNIRRELREATERLKEQRKEDEILCVLWAVHFPPDYPGCPNESRLLGEEKLIQTANTAGVSAVLAGHTHKQLNYRNPSMSFRVFCCGTTTQHEPQAMVGGRDELDARKGNLFQIITVVADEAGKVKMSAKDFRYSGFGPQSNRRDIPWVEFPSDAEE
jgi:hypothetical protein